MGIEGTVLVDETGDFARDLGVRGVPTNVCVDADGIVRAVGVSMPAELRAALARLHPEAAALLGEGKAARLSAAAGMRRGPVGRDGT